MVDYLAFMKQTSKTLKLAGEDVPFNYVMSCILVGLEAEFIVIVCQI